MTGKTVRAIHLYEELGLLQPSERSRGGYRLFDSDAVIRTRWITKLQGLGLSLNEIRRVLKHWNDPATASIAIERVRALFQQQLALVRHQRQQLNALEQEIEVSLHYLDRCGPCQRARFECPSCTRNGAVPPDLVAGFSAQPEEG